MRGFTYLEEWRKTLLIKSIVCCLTALMMSASVMAAPICPSAKAVKKTPFDIVSKGDHPGVWTLTQSNHQYDTQDHWNFVLMIEADDQVEAVKKANKALATLPKPKQPQPAGNIWTCEYRTKLAMSALAVFQLPKS